MHLSVEALECIFYFVLCRTYCVIFIVVILSSYIDITILTNI